MPIPRELFDRQLDPLDKRIMDVLDADPSQAFTLEDLAAKVDYEIATLTSRVSLLVRMIDLTQRSFILSKDIRGTIYYASAKLPQA